MIDISVTFEFNINGVLSQESYQITELITGSCDADDIAENLLWSIPNREFCIGSFIERYEKINKQWVKIN